MSMERFLLIAMVIIPVFSFLYIPKNQFKKALMSFLAFQATTWFVSIMLVETETVVFPVREFVKATRIVFITEFFFYPIIFVWFIFLAPKMISLKYKILHWCLFISLTSWLAYFLGKYTDLSEFVRGNVYFGMFNTYWLFTLQYLICYYYVKWLYKKECQKGE
ncbi:MAG: hypothetical protein K0Q99_1068 [Clostridia bacterium]|jgi:hypothetical protein|nr:hypothetical protein [Clostridia bacterium]